MVCIRLRHLLFHFHLGGGSCVPARADTQASDNNSTPTNGPKKMLGKLFKKKDNRPSSPSPSPIISHKQSLFRTARPSTGQSLSVPSPRNTKWLGSHHLPARTHAEPSPTPTVSSITTTNSHLQPPVLGIHPLCSSPSYPPQGRPHSYTWIVRKWIKGSNESLLE
jgi:hypothetical protein